MKKTVHHFTQVAVGHLQFFNDDFVVFGFLGSNTDDYILLGTWRENIGSHCIKITRASSRLSCHHAIFVIELQLI